MKGPQKQKTQKNLILTSVFSCWTGGLRSSTELSVWKWPSGKCWTLNTLYRPLSELLLWLFKGTLLHTCKSCILWKWLEQTWTLRTVHVWNSRWCCWVSKRGAGFAASVIPPFVFCSVSQWMARPSERITTGYTAAHRETPAHQNCGCCLKLYKKHRIYYMHQDC